MEVILESNRFCIFKGWTPSTFCTFTSAQAIKTKGCFCMHHNARKARWSPTTAKKLVPTILSPFSQAKIHTQHLRLHMPGSHLRISQVNKLTGPLCYAMPPSINKRMTSPILLTCHRDQEPDVYERENMVLSCLSVLPQLSWGEVNFWNTLHCNTKWWQSPERFS